jgi:hypothetical protein
MDNFGVERGSWVRIPAIFQNFKLNTVMQNPELEKLQQDIQSLVVYAQRKYPQISTKVSLKASGLLECIGIMLTTPESGNPDKNQDTVKA